MATTIRLGKIKQVNYCDSTVDHKIPLMRGGLDNPSNFVLSCKPCNEQRGHNMPELGK